MFRFKKNNKLVINNDEDIGSFLKNARVNKELTQVELGDILNVSSKTVSKWENNYVFPDASIQIPLCNTLGITLEELHAGRINTDIRNKEKKETMTKRILVFLIVLLIIMNIIFHVRIIYYKYYYNPLSLYYIDVTNDDQTICNIDGYYIKDRNVNILYIGNLKLLTEDILDTDIIEVNFIHNKEIIFTASDIKNISINLKDDIDPKDISIEIKITDYKTNKEKFNKNFRIDLTEKDSKISNFDYNIPNTSLTEELIKMGFGKQDGVTYKKVTKDEEVAYNAESQTIIINTFSENKFTIEYRLTENMINISLISKINNDYVMTEKYTYNLKTKEIKNNIGHGYSLNIVLKLLTPYITLQNRYLGYPN